MFPKVTVVTVVFLSSKLNTRNRILERKIVLQTLSDPKEIKIPAEFGIRWSVLNK